MFIRAKLSEEATRLDVVPRDDVGDDNLLSDLCTDAVYYLDLETHTDLFTEEVTHLTSKTE